MLRIDFGPAHKGIQQRGPAEVLGFVAIPEQLQEADDVIFGRKIRQQLLS